MATALEFLKEQLSGVGGLIATALHFLMEQLSGVGGLIATALEFLMEHPNGYSGALQDMRKEIEEALKGLKERLGDDHPQKEELLQGLKDSIAEFRWGVLSNLLLVLKNKTNELGDALQVTKEATSQFLQEKLPWVIALWTAAVDFLVQKLEALLPPGTSSDTVRIWVQLVMPSLLFLSLPVLRKYFVPILQFFLCGCFVLVRYTMIACAKASYWAIVMIKAFARAAWGGGKMMKAPGRGGKAFVFPGLFSSPIPEATSEPSTPTPHFWEQVPCRHGLSSWPDWSPPAWCFSSSCEALFRHWICPFWSWAC